VSFARDGFDRGLDRGLTQRLRLPEVIPETLTGVRLTVAYTRAAVAAGRLAEALDREFGMAGAVDDLAALLRAGFLSRPPVGPAPARAGLARVGPDCIVVDVEGPGLHPNVILLLLRLAHAEHQSPPEATLEALTEALDGDEEAARAAHDTNTFAEIVDALTVEVTGRLDAPASPLDIARARRRGAHLPATGPLGPDPIVSAAEIRFAGMTTAELDDDLEDACLSLSMGGAFLPLGFRPEFEPGDEELFFTEGADGRPVLVVREITMEEVFLFELAACLNGGALAGVRAELRAE
jgi:hypothetical protein